MADASWNTRHFPADGPDTRSGDAMRAALERRMTDPGGPDAVESATPGTAGSILPPPRVPDHTLIQRIGGGAYGDVWMARNALGTHRAVKVVHRARFRDERPYEREFHGILKYEPISRTHEGLVQILHVGRDEERQCFYYVMELADGVATPGNAGGDADDSKAASVVASGYAPRTLRSELGPRSRVSPVEAARWALRLAGALAHLHAHGLVHRDIKPSNVIFVGGQPKLADIGLVTDVGSSQSFVGTEGFIPPEGPGMPQGDLYALGKLLYELATGRDRMDFPQLPPEVPRLPEGEALLELNEVIVRACAPEAGRRYGSATEFQAELNLFLAGRSLRHARNLERTLARLKRFAYVACAFVAVSAVALWIFKNEERHARELAREANERAHVEASSREIEATLRRRAESAERATQQQLFTALLEQARATVLSREMGQRVRALDAIRRAAAITNSAELRREVFTALALADVRFQRELSYGTDYTMRSMDPLFERIALCRPRGPVEIRSTADGALLATLAASTNLPAYVGRWSADGRILLAKRDYPPGGLRSDWEVWDIAEARLIHVFRDVPRDAIAIHPRGRQILVCNRNGEATFWNLDAARDTIRFKLAAAPSVLEFAPDGARLAAIHASGRQWTVAIYDAVDGKLLVSHAFRDFVGSVAWHPEGRWLAACDDGGNLHAIDAGTGESHVLGRHKAEARIVKFSPDGAWMISGSWDRELYCWDARSMQRVFRADIHVQVAYFRSDSRVLTIVTPAGLQLHALERPAGFREFPEDLGTRLAHAAFSPDGRWLAASADKQMGVWDLSSDGGAALEPKAYGAECYFTPDGREVFASRNTAGGDNAGFRWRLTPAATPGRAPHLERLSLVRPAGFASVSLASNAVVMISTNGSQLLPSGDAGLDKDGWRSTVAGESRVSPDGRWLGIHQHYSPSLFVYGLPGLASVARLTQSSALGRIGYFEFSPLGGQVALYSTRGVELWSTATWKRTHVLTNFTRPFLYSPDGRAFWAAKELRLAGLYDARTFEPTFLLPNGMLPLAVSRDGRHLAVSVDSQRLQVWDLKAVRDEFRMLGLDWTESTGP